MRGHERVHVPQKTPTTFQRGRLCAAVFDAIWDGPKTGRQIAKHVEERHGRATADVYQRV